MTRLRSLHLVASSTTPLRTTLYGMLDLVKHSPETLSHVGVQNRSVEEQLKAELLRNSAKLPPQSALYLA
jgi:hypothetical protein